MSRPDDRYRDRSPERFAVEAGLEERRGARRAASCAAGIGHAVAADSPECDACGWDVRREIPRRLLT